jgi:hypothetical protein
MKSELITTVCAECGGPFPCKQHPNAPASTSRYSPRSEIDPAKLTEDALIEWERVKMTVRLDERVHLAVESLIREFQSLVASLEQEVQDADDEILRLQQEARHKLAERDEALRKIELLAIQRLDMGGDDEETKRFLRLFNRIRDTALAARGGGE